MGKASVLIVLSDSIIQGRLSLFQFKFQNLHKIFYALELINEAFVALDELSPFQINLDNADKIGAILLDSTKTHSDRQRFCTKILPMPNTATKKRDKKIATQLLKLILGMNANTAVIFNIDKKDKAYKINLCDTSNDNKLTNLASLLTLNQNELFA